MDNKELNIETAAISEENLDAVAGGHWDEDAPIPEKVWGKMNSYERYTYNTLTQRSDKMKEAGDISEARRYYREAVAFQIEMKRKYDN